ncbi:Mrl1p KNAG_0A07340 [Huiozyma naganishii CBS 8797]|uniref:MRH domain-containing protein n=1 Tax=Huiozyma naganishii (strain ATCC MYA-139 / BCRC 22969 / CBS 8797 / KCTC 17520 / NBRC 10181 / NCYC 3082 / Yp74L-3) TaxID=1071383 RepID=J7RU86_HUIN7|nr:hypothetical protein KNAG_0A07340 [Kazachstania naganishii CBS 8797]CCK68387.1 hypothetical protein KNAG_0A07340 [Kazachstania naganishii CBS 8797]
MLEQPKDPFCAVTNPASGSFIDLSQLSASPNKQNTKKKGGQKTNFDKSKTRWLVKGYGPDLGLNFTLSVCSSPVVDESDESHQLKNTTGAYYFDSKRGKYVSIGDFSTKPKLFGVTSKKLTLEYGNGDSCPNSVDRKSTLLNFVCDRDILNSKAQISYIGDLHNCSYFFEVRSVYACPTSTNNNEFNAWGIFFGIFAVFCLVEFCRRWIAAMTQRGRTLDASLAPPAAAAARGDSTASPYGLPDTSTNSAVPRWEFIEDESIFTRFIRSVTDWTRYWRPRGHPFRRSSTPSARNTIRLNSPSESSYFRDMETQNEILDSLDSTTTRSSN